MTEMSQGVPLARITEVANVDPKNNVIYIDFGGTVGTRITFSEQMLSNRANTPGLLLNRDFPRLINAIKRALEDRNVHKRATERANEVVSASDIARGRRFFSIAIEGCEVMYGVDRDFKNIEIEAVMPPVIPAPRKRAQSKEAEAPVLKLSAAERADKLQLRVISTSKVTAISALFLLTWGILTGLQSRPHSQNAARIVEAEQARLRAGVPTAGLAKKLEIARKSNRSLEESQAELLDLEDSPPYLASISRPLVMASRGPAFVAGPTLVSQPAKNDCGIFYDTTSVTAALAEFEALNRSQVPKRLAVHGTARMYASDICER